MFCVYIIRSVNQPDQTYIGFTRDIKQRLLTHNQNRGPHTAKFSPWRIEFYCAFKQEDKALAFERHLKSHSGKAFASKRLLQTNFRPEPRPADFRLDFHRHELEPYVPDTTNYGPRLFV